MTEHEYSSTYELSDEERKAFNPDLPEYLVDQGLFAYLPVKKECEALHATECGLGTAVEITQTSVSYTILCEAARRRDCQRLCDKTRDALAERLTKFAKNEYERN